MKRLKILSLFWHSVDSDSINPEYIDGSNPTVSMFRDQIKYIVSKYTPISIVDFMKIMENRKLIRSYVKPPVLLGFDDGFKNVLDNALPVLNEFNVPAIFFVIGEILKNPNFVPWDVELKQIILRTNKKMVTHDNVKMDLVSIQRLFVNSFKASRSEEDRQRLMSYFENLLDVERPKASELDEHFRFVSKEDLAGLSSKSLLTVASHAMTHRFLGSLTYEEQFYELEQSNLLLKEYCPSYYPVLAYPVGSFNTKTIEIAKHIYKSAFATRIGSSYHNLYAYPRFCLGYSPVKQLAYALSFVRLNFLLPVKRFLHSTGIRKID